MLDKEIYGLMVILGILLAMLYFFVMCIFINVDNAKMRRRCKNHPEMAAYLRKENIKGILLIVGVVLLGLCLILAKKAFLD